MRLTGTRLRPEPDAVLFDVGSTLIHADPVILTTCLTRYGVRDVAPEDASAAFVLALEASRELLPRGLDDIAKEAARWGQLLGIAPGPAMAAFRDVLDTPGLYRCVDPDALVVLDALRAAGVLLVAVANADGNVAEELAEAGLREFFDVTVDSAVLGVEKPRPEIFHDACRQVGIPPARSCFVGDGLINDLLGAWAAGIGRCVLYDPLGLRPELPGALRIGRLTELLDVTGEER
ncbi:HAD-IA family hydrolase [Streptosporangium sp. KLBMP 9127]|nr:HAD family hydrolase [Streptosporangium sp. KLBMP 9127]